MYAELLLYSGFDNTLAGLKAFYAKLKSFDKYDFGDYSPGAINTVTWGTLGESAASFKATIKAFEADQRIAKILESNIQQNGLTNIEIIPKAVWTDNQGIDIASDGADGASIFGENQKQHTPSVRLKDLLAKEAQVDMLKIDIEGAEIAVIEDCDDVLDKVQHLFVEYHAYIGQPQNLSKLLATLEKHQFRYFIRDDQDRVSPFVNHQFRDNNLMDLRLNIFAYKG